MGDLLVIIVMILYMFAAASGKSKKGKKKQERREKRANGRRTAFEQAFDQTASKAVECRKRANTAASAQTQGEMECAQQRMHLHEVTQAQMHMAGEGEDPCHHGGESAGHEAQSTAFSYDETEKEKSALAQDVLRGVIMSEILTRPCDRAALRRNGRRAV